MLTLLPQKGRSFFVERLIFAEAVTPSAATPRRRVPAGVASGPPDQRKIRRRLRSRQKLQFLRRADDQPEHFGAGVVEDLAQRFWSHEHAAVLRHRQRFATDAHPPRPFEDEVNSSCRTCLCSVLALPGGNRHSRALRFSLPVRSRKSAFGIFIRFDGRQERSSGLMGITLDCFHRISREHLANSEGTPLPSCLTSRRVRKLRPALALKCRCVPSASRY
jgi:hypothetical protein